MFCNKLNFKINDFFNYTHEQNSRQRIGFSYKNFCQASNIRYFMNSNLR